MSVMFGDTHRRVTWDCGDYKGLKGCNSLSTKMDDLNCGCFFAGKSAARKTRRRDLIFVTSHSPTRFDVFLSVGTLKNRSFTAFGVSRSEIGIAGRNVTVTPWSGCDEKRFFACYIVIVQDNSWREKPLKPIIEKTGKKALPAADKPMAVWFEPNAVPFYFGSAQVI